MLCAKLNAELNSNFCGQLNPPRSPVALMVCSRLVHWPLSSPLQLPACLRIPHRAQLCVINSYNMHQLEHDNAFDV